MLAGFGRELIGDELLVIAVCEDPQLAALKENEIYGPPLVPCISEREVKNSNVCQRVCVRRLNVIACRL